ncbi:hypothetical protein ACSS6W_004310 [Trichoderma asperelloides]
MASGSNAAQSQEHHLPIETIICLFIFRVPLHVTDLVISGKDNIDTRLSQKPCNLL